MLSNSSSRTDAVAVAAANIQGIFLSLSETPPPLFYHVAVLVYSPASALDTVGFETMTGVTPGAFVIASRCTKPIRPIPITPTLIMSLVSTFSTFMESVDDDRRTAKERVDENAEAIDERPATTRRETSFIFRLFRCDQEQTEKLREKIPTNRAGCQHLFIVRHAEQQGRAAKPRKKWANVARS